MPSTTLVVECSRRPCTSHLAEQLPIRALHFCRAIAPWFPSPAHSCKVPDSMCNRSHLARSAHRVRGPRSMSRPRGDTTFHDGDGEPWPEFPVDTRFRLRVRSGDSGNWFLESMNAGLRVLLNVRVRAWQWLVRDEPRVAHAETQTEHSGPVWYMEV